MPVVAHVSLTSVAGSESVTATRRAVRHRDEAGAVTAILLNRDRERVLGAGQVGRVGTDQRLVRDPRLLRGRGLSNVKLIVRVGCGIVVELMPVIVSVPVPGTVGVPMTTVHSPLVLVPGPSVGSHVLSPVTSAEPAGPVHVYVSVVPGDTGWKPQVRRRSTGRSA